MKDVLRASYDRSASEYDERFRPLQRPKYEALLGPGGGALAAVRGRALDLGCGTGLLAEWLEDAGVPRPGLVGLDLSHAMLVQARARGLRAVEGDLERLPFLDGAFAAVLAFTALGILPGSPARALAEAARVLERGGLLAVTVLRTSWTEGLEDELRAAGFAAGARRECGQDYGYICVRR